MTAGNFPHERPTRPDSSALRAVGPVSEAPPATLEELVGQMMAATAQNTRVIEALSVQVGTLTARLGEHMQEATQHKDEIKAVTTKAAAHGSNRLALLLGALVTIYEIAAPALHELAKWVHQ